jgi:hypothetical protein
VDETANPSAPVEWDLQDWPTDQIPVVFKKPPVSYEVATSDRLAEWEAMLGDRVKLSPETFSADGYLPSISYCGPNETNACDSDTIATALEA